jgi:tetratricopeptide (TPR) repeat protein
MSNALEQSTKAYQRGRELLESGDLPGAIAQFEASIALSPHFKSLELLGETLMKSGQMVRAIVPLAAATALNAQVRAPSLLAEALLASGDPLKAHEISKLALARDSSNRRARAVFDATPAAYESHNL